MYRLRASWSSGNLPKNARRASEKDKAARSRGYAALAV